VAFRRWSADGTTRYHGRVDASALPYYIDRSALGERTGTVFEVIALPHRLSARRPIRGWPSRF